MISKAKKYVAVLLLFVCVSMIFSPQTVYAAEDSSQHETVKVGFFAMDGYHVMDEEGNRSGYGYDATKAIRRSSHEAAKKIPIIAMSANAFSEDVQHSLAAGMNAHISKPVEMKVLEKTIRSIKSGGGGYRTAGH